MTKRMMGILAIATLTVSSVLGCQAPAATPVPPGAQVPMLGAATADTRELLSLDQEMGDIELLADLTSRTGYAVQMADQADDHRPSLEDRQSARATRNAARLAKLADIRTRIAEHAQGGPWADNGDGTESQDIEVDQQGPGGDRAVTITRTRTKGGELKSSTVSFAKATARQSKTSTRTRTLNADGSMTITFHCEHELPNGTTRIADWTKTVGQAGGVTGSGSIVWKNRQGATIRETQLWLGGTEDEPQGGSHDEGGAPSASPSGQPGPNEEHGQAGDHAQNGADNAGGPDTKGKSDEHKPAV